METIENELSLSYEENRGYEDLVKEQNQIITDTVLQEYPKFFEEMILDDGSNVALFHNNVWITQEQKEILPKYEYIAMSQHGLTLFNCSYSTLEWERTKKAIEYLIDLSCGEEVKDLIVSHWHQFHRVRRTKGLLKLKMNIKSVLITGVNLLYDVKDFYENVLKPTELNSYPSITVS